MLKSYLIGMMSGTSLDAVDAVLIETKTNKVIKHVDTNLSDELKLDLFELNQSQHNDLHLSKIAEYKMTQLYVETYEKLLRATSIKSSEIIAIGAHGQTIRHEPNAEFPYTIQLLNGALLSHLTKQTVVCDFRSKDIAAGGQGAPLAPLFHQSIFNLSNSFVVVNIGGISNISVIEKSKDLNAGITTYGFDTGPGNCLLDEWINKHQQKNYDKNAAWANTGNVDFALLDKMLEDRYFKLPFPKSTGRDYFNLTWLELFGINDYEPKDVMRTLVRLTASCIAKQIPDNLKIRKIIIAGGGANNPLLMSDLTDLLGDNVISSDELGIDCQHLESVGFAWLAGKTMNKEKLDAISITGAVEASVLGAIHYY